MGTMVLLCRGLLQEGIGSAAESAHIRVPSRSSTRDNAQGLQWGPSAFCTHEVQGLWGPGDVSMFLTS